MDEDRFDALVNHVIGYAILNDPGLLERAVAELKRAIALAELHARVEEVAAFECGQDSAAAEHQFKRTGELMANRLRLADAKTL